MVFISLHTGFRREKVKVTFFNAQIPQCTRDEIPLVFSELSPWCDIWGALEYWRLLAVNIARLTFQILDLFLTYGTIAPFRTIALNAKNARGPWCGRGPHIGMIAVYVYSTTRSSDSLLSNCKCLIENSKSFYSSHSIKNNLTHGRSCTDTSRLVIPLF